MKRMTLLLRLSVAREWLLGFPICGTLTIFIALLSLTGSPESLEEREAYRLVEYHAEN